MNPNRDGLSLGERRRIEPRLQPIRDPLDTAFVRLCAGAGAIALIILTLALWSCAR